MENLINFDDVNTKIITIREQNVILDSDVATLYGVETKRVNEAIKNNPDKFPEGYVFQLKANEYDVLKALSEKSQQLDNQGAVENFDRTLKTSQLATIFEKTRVLPKVFTEKGLYMLATILKSPQATQATIAIVEAFAKLKQLSNNIAFLNSMDPEVIEPEIVESTMEKTTGLLSDLFFSALPTSAETSVEVNLGLIKAKRSIKSEKPIYQSEFDELKRMILDIKNEIKK